MVKEGAAWAWVSDSVAWSQVSVADSLEEGGTRTAWRSPRAWGPRRTNAERPARRGARTAAARLAGAERQQAV